MYGKKIITIIVPAFNEEKLIGTTLQTMPNFIDQIIAIDDCSTDNTYQMMRECAQSDSRITVIHHEKNRGVGGAIKSGLNQFTRSESNIMVIMAGDNQMDPSFLPSILDPIVASNADIVKGNRLVRDMWKGMSLWRLSGNLILTYITKIATGYYNIRDPQNGYVGATKEAICLMDPSSMYEGYAFENDFMIRANIAGLRMENAAIPARYGIEKSGIIYTKFIVNTSCFLLRSYLFRLKSKYLVKERMPSSIVEYTKE